MTKTEIPRLNGASERGLQASLGLSLAKAVSPLPLCHRSPKSRKVWCLSSFIGVRRDGLKQLMNSLARWCELHWHRAAKANLLHCFTGAGGKHSLNLKPLCC